MAVFDPVSNFGYGTVSVPPSPALSGLTLTLQAGEGALFPDAAVDGDFNVTAYPPDTGPLLSNAEILRVSDNTSDVFTFARGQEGTIAKAIAAGWQIAFAPTAKTMQDIFDAINALGPGSGTVTTVSVVTANGVSGSVATATTTPAITLTLGAITPTTVVASGNVSGANLSGTNTGDQTSVSGNAGTATALQTARNINGVSFNGTANITIATNSLVLLLGLADGTSSGITEAGTAGATLAFGDLVYLQASDSRWELADADAAATSGPLKLGMCVLAAAADGDPTIILRRGTIRADAKFPTLTIGAPAYVSTTTGEIQVAQPSGTDDVIRIVGHGNTANELDFNPSNDWMEHV